MVWMEAAAADTSAPSAVSAGVSALLAAHRAARRLLVLHSRHGGGIDSVLRELRRALLAERESLFEGNCRPDGATYRPLREIVSRWTRTLEDLGALDAETEALIAHVATSLGLAAPGVGAGSASGSEGPGQLRFFEQLGSVLHTMSERIPAVIVVHDLHLADSATAAAVRFLVENVFSDPVGRCAAPGRRPPFAGTVVVTTSEADGGFDALQASLADREHCSFVGLGDIEEEQVRRFVNSPEVLEQLVQASGGVPENLRELFAALPRRIEDLYARRFDRLGRSERRVLEVLAVLGRPVKPDFLLRVAEPGDDLPSLAALTEQRLLVRQVSRGELLVDFPSAENRRLVHDAIPDDRRRMLHGRVAALLEERSRLGEPVDIETIAHHYLSSNVDPKAVSYAIEAAERLHISWAWQRAREVLLEALPRVREPAERLAVLERLVELGAGLGMHGDAIARADELLALVGPERRAVVLRKRGEIRLETGEFDLAVADAEAARADSGDDLALDERLRVAALLAEALYGRGDYDAAVASARASRELAPRRPTGEVARQIVRLTNTIGKVFLFLGRYDDALAEFAANGELARSEGLGQEEVRALFNQGTIALQQRRYDAAERTFRRCLEFRAEVANPVTRSFLELNLGVIYHKTLRYGDALRAYLESLARFRQSGNDLQYAVAAMNLGSLYETLGDHGRARTLLDASIAISERRRMRYFLGRALYVLGTLDLLEERWESALGSLERAAELLGRTGSTFAGRIRVALARAQHGLGNAAARDALMAEALEDAAGPESEELLGEHALYRGVFAHADRDLEQGAAALADAVDIFGRNEQHERVWLAQGWLGLNVAARGDTAAALRLLEAAVARIAQIAEEVPESLRATYRDAPERRLFRDALDALRQGRRIEATGPVPAAESAHDAGFRRWRKRYEAIVGDDERLLQLLRVVDRISDSTSTVLIQGESGTGKELVAEAIHQQSSRREGPFVKVNCAAFVETLLLSELFGHEKGAFTGALARKKGRFELADGGTLFLDEIGDISANTQVALLRVLQEHTFERVGGGETLHADVRLICATNRNLEEMVRAGTFRLDLYYRLKGVVVELPPLRDRRADIPQLIAHFCAQLAKSGGRRRRFSRDALEWLVRYSWPGNIRELENFVRSMLLFVDGEHVELSNVLQFEDFFADGSFVDRVDDAVLGACARAAHAAEPAGAPPVQLAAGAASAPAGAESPAAAPVDVSVDDLSIVTRLADAAYGSGLGLSDLKDRLEVELIRRALVEAGGNIAHAARLLDMKRPRLSQIVNGTPELEELRQRLAGGSGDEDVG